jgi:hypothetical protein
MSGQTSIEDWIGFGNLLHAARVHVAAKEKHARNALGNLRGDDQTDWNAPQIPVAVPHPTSRLRSRIERGSGLRFFQPNFSAASE